MAYQAHTHEISRSRHNNLQVLPMKDVRLQKLTEITQKLLPVHPETGMRRKRKKSNYKAFCVTRKRKKIEINNGSNSGINKLKHIKTFYI